MIDKEKQPFFMPPRQNGKSTRAVAEELIHYVENVLEIPLSEYQKGLIRAWIWHWMYYS